ncbi:hypothetical protein C7W88_18265 (plasmid) [Novosphingobium sp. THN1]|nr:hypothetical protein C7W88_18265 [Novosphingobium sp. THN1]
MDKQCDGPARWAFIEMMQAKPLDLAPVGAEGIIEMFKCLVRGSKNVHVTCSNFSESFLTYGYPPSYKLSIGNLSRGSWAGW